MSNRNSPERWKEDVRMSVDFYNDWFLRFAPSAFRNSRVEATKAVENALVNSNYFRDISSNMLKQYPSIVTTLRMSTCPPIAVDRLIGLSGVSKNLIECMEKKGVVPPNTTSFQLDKIVDIISRLLDKDIFPWLNSSIIPEDNETFRAATVIADRLCGSLANPIIRNAQESRQLLEIEQWLITRGYKKVPSGQKLTWQKMEPGTFSFRLVVPIHQISDGEPRSVNIPIDAVIMPITASQGDFPFLLEAKSAGDFTNVNKRRKEEAVKFSQLQATYGKKTRLVLFLCGYFDTGYLGYSAAEGLDWVWEHRIQDLENFGI